MEPKGFCSDVSTDDVIRAYVHLKKVSNEIHLMKQYEQVLEHRKRGLEEKEKRIIADALLDDPLDVLFITEEHAGCKKKNQHLKEEIKEKEKDITQLIEECHRLGIRCEVYGNGWRLIK